MFLIARLPAIATGYATLLALASYFNLETALAVVGYTANAPGGAGLTTGLILALAIFGMFTFARQPPHEVRGEWVLATIIVVAHSAGIALAILAVYTPDGLAAWLTRANALYLGIPLLMVGGASAAATVAVLNGDLDD